jgi:gamma-glutamyltranspeptidase / glutathione hydrolase
MIRTTVITSLIALAAAYAQSPAPERRSGTDRPGQTMKTLARGAEFAAVSIMPQAALTEERVLRAGGNAFDAVVAGQAVLGVVQPASNGIGSDAVLLVYDAKRGKVFSINAEGTAPKMATIDWYKNHKDGKLPVDDSLLAGTVPGVVDAWYILLSRWGTKSFSELLAPAIELAERGVPVARGAMRSPGLLKYPTSTRVYGPPDGKAWQDGELWRNPDLARTFRRLVEAEQEAMPQGRQAGLKAARDRFYKGDIAREMARFSEESGGLFRYEDFSDYSAKVEEPVSIDYRGYTVYKNPSASQGPAELMALNILEGYDLKKMGLNSADYIHTCVEAIKLAMADRDTYMGDMDFVQIPFQGLLSKEYAASRRKLIDPGRASLEFRPGDVAPFAGADYKIVDRPRDVTLSGDADHLGDTSYIAAVDRERNMISFTPSLHSGFGTKMVMGKLGFTFNCRGDYYSLVAGHANALEPRKRPRSTLQGTLVLKDGKPYLVTGSPGGDDQCMRTMQTLLNIVDFGMNIQQAIEAPRWSTRSFPASPFPHTMYPGDLWIEGRISNAIRDELAQRGHKVRVRAPWSMNDSAGIVVDNVHNTLTAGADPRTTASALAW